MTLNMKVELHYIVILHQTTTGSYLNAGTGLLHYIVILHQTTTCTLQMLFNMLLHYIVILHQTTTDFQTAMLGA